MSKGFGSFRLGKLSGASEFSELLEDNAESNADGGGLACQVSEECSRVPQRLPGPFVWYFELRICVFWSAESEELVVIKKDQYHWSKIFVLLNQLMLVSWWWCIINVSHRGTVFRKLFFQGQYSTHKLRSEEAKTAFQIAGICWNRPWVENFCFRTW